MKSKIIIIFFLMIAFNLWADEEASQYAYVKSSSGGRYYFKMIPEVPYNRTKGKGILYAVSGDQSDKVLWRVNGWYAFDTYISHDGRYLVRLGNWPRGRKPSHKHLGIAFYDKGTLIKKYSTKDLIKNPSAIMISISHYQFLAKVLGFEPIYSYRFKIRTVDKIEYIFDVTKGTIISQKKVK